MTRKILRTTHLTIRSQSLT